MLLDDRKKEVAAAKLRRAYVRNTLFGDVKLREAKDVKLREALDAALVELKEHVETSDKNRAKYKQARRSGAKQLRTLRKKATVKQIRIERRQEQQNS